MFLAYKGEAEVLIKDHTYYFAEKAVRRFLKMKGGKENASHFKYSRHTLKPNNNLTTCLPAGRCKH
jgi:hypothetical protein